MHRALVPGAVAAIVCTVSASVAEPTALSYAWRAGDTHRYRVVQEIGASLVSAEPGAPAVSLTNTMDLVVRLEIVEVGAAGAATAKAFFESVRSRTKPPFGPEMTYDSASGEEVKDDDPFGIVMSALLGAELTLTIGPDGEVPTLSGMGRIWEKAAAARPAVAREIRNATGVISDESIRAILGQALHALPKQPLEVGGSCPLAVEPIGAAESALHLTGTTTLTRIEVAEDGAPAHLASAYTVAAGPAGEPHLEGSGERKTVFDTRRRYVVRSEAWMRASSREKDGEAKQEITTVVKLERLPDRTPE